MPTQNNSSPTPVPGATPGPSAGLEDFSPRDRYLIEKTEEAIRDGSQLERWYRQQEHNLSFFPLALKKEYRLPNRAQGFFAALEINGQPRTVMGCLQKIEFGQVAHSNSAQLLRQFVLEEFLKRAHWSYEDGSPGGFTFGRNLFKSAEGHCGRFPAEARDGRVDWRELGPKYAWVLLTVNIHDFVVGFGPFRKRIREAAYVAPHPDFVHVIEDPNPECILEVSVGYPFVDVPPFPNFFGFGPGKFGVAVKLFTFFLTTENKIRVRMVFAAAPRAQKVFDLGKRFPDPVYGGAELLRYLTLGLVQPDGIHDRMDAQMLALHCRVHQTLMDGVEKVWRDWVSSKS